MAALVFTRARYTGGPIALVFGATGGSVPPEVSAATAVGTGVLGGINGQGLALYDNRTPLRASTSAGLRHQQARPAGAQAANGSGPGVPTPWTGGIHWTPASASGQRFAAPWLGTDPRAGQSAARHQQARPAADQMAARHQSAEQIAAQAAARQQQARAHTATAELPHQVAAIAAARQIAAALAAALQAHRQAASGYQRAAISGRDLRAPWQQARAVPPGREAWPPEIPEPIEPRVIDLRLVFECPPLAPGAAPALIFGRVCYLPPVGPGAPYYILPARYYMAVHSLTAHRLPDETQIPIYDVSLSADVGSFGWSLSASAPVGAFEALAPAGGLPVQLRVTLDGLAFRFVVDGLQRQEAFGSRSVRISGRSPSALLAAPLARETARTNTAARTAQQLALEALDLSGFALDWGLTDWLVPAGAWSHSGTPLAAVQAIVGAAGGYLQSHRSALTLLARHPYPERPAAVGGGLLAGGPWSWAQAVPDLELAPDALLVTGIERADGPAVNAVYASGTTQGVLARVRRTGTAGDLLAPLVTDPLITAAEAARQRGIAVVGAAGAKQRVTLELPVLTGAGQPGVLDVGQLVQVNAAQPWRGMVRAVSASAAHGGQVRQSVQIERDMAEA